MQSTTANLRRVEQMKMERAYWLLPLALVGLCLLFIALSSLYNAVHEASDPAYKQEIEHERATQRAIDEQFSKIEQAHKVSK